MLVEGANSEPFVMVVDAAAAVIAVRAAVDVIVVLLERSTVRLNVGSLAFSCISMGTPVDGA